MPFGLELSADLLVLFLFLTPGFIVIVLVNAASGSGLGRLKNDLHTALLSLFLSCVIWLLTYGTAGSLHSPAEMARYAQDHPLMTLGRIVFWLAAVAVALMAMLRFSPLSWLTRLLAGGSRLVRMDRVLWDRVMGQNERKPAYVMTKDGKFFMGFLAGYSTQDEPQAIHLQNVQEVSYGKDGEPESVDLGDSLLLQGDDIHRVLFLAGPAAEPEDT